LDPTTLKEFTLLLKDNVKYNSNALEEGFNFKMSAEDIEEEINCSNICRREAILAKIIDYNNRENQTIVAGSEFENLYKSWEDYNPNFNLPSSSSVNAEDSSSLIELQNKITSTIDWIKDCLVKKEILAIEDNNPNQIHTTQGLELLKTDLIRRSDTEFKTQIPDYVRKFIQYIALLETKEIEEQRAFLVQFPPDSIHEYQCHDGAKSRLEAVYSSAKPSSIILQSHDIVSETKANEFRQSVYEGNHPHILPFINYLLGVNRNLVGNIDNFYLTPNNDIKVKQVYDLIKNYEHQLSEVYLEKIRKDKQKLIDEIVKITNENNQNAIEGKTAPVDVYNQIEIKRLLCQYLDISELEADEIIIAISQEGEILSKEESKVESKDEDFDNLIESKSEEGDENRKVIYWLTLDQSNTNEENQNISEVLEEKIAEIIDKKANYFKRINRENIDAVADDIIDLSKVNELIESTKTILTENRANLNLAEINGIYALRALAEKLKDDQPIHFIVASDHLVNQREVLLAKAQDDIVLKNYINRIYEVREIYLGEQNKDQKIENLNPVFHAILTKNSEKLSEILTNFDIIIDVLQSFTDNNYNGDLTNFGIINILRFIPNNDNSDRILWRNGAINLTEAEKIKYKSPLYYAINSNDKNIIKKILEENNGNIINFLHQTRQDLGNYLILQYAISENKVEVVKAMLENKTLNNDPELFKEFINAKDKDGNSILHLAVIYGKTEVVKAILENETLKNNPDLFKEVINVKDWDDDLALHVAVVSGKTEVVKAILENETLKNNSDLFKEVINVKDRYSSSIIHIALKSGKTEVVKAILENETLKNDPEHFKAFINAKDKDGDSILHLATRFGIIEAINTILENETLKNNPELFKKFINHKNYGGESAFDIAVKSGSDIATIEIVKTILKHDILKNNAELFEQIISVKDRDGDSILHLAVIYSETDIVRAVLENDILKKDYNLFKKVINAINNAGDLPLNSAAINNDTEVVKELLSKGALSAEKNIPYPLNDSYKIIDQAKKDSLAIINEIIKNDPEHLKTLLSEMPSERLELAVNISVRVSTNTSVIRTPMQVAAEIGNIEIVEALIEKNADFNISNNMGKPALFYAAENNYIDVFKFLVDKGANYDVIDDNQRKPAEYFDENSRKEIEDFLSTKSSNNWQNNPMNTPSNLSIVHLNSDVKGNNIKLP
jgi:ankyrin repeat protein